MREIAWHENECENFSGSSWYKFEWVSEWTNEGNGEEIGDIASIQAINESFLFLFRKNIKLWRKFWNLLSKREA
jgi:hypothetical protein